MKHWPYLLTALAVFVTFGFRWFGPSDLYDNDQPKTVAYTVDMVRQGHWLIPVDMLGRPATKPPMYNWLGAPAVAAGWHSEFALKLPSTLAAMVTLALTWYAARRVGCNILSVDGPLDPEKPPTKPALSTATASIACICLLASYSFSKLCYTARPDMVLTAFTTAGWLSSSVLLIRDKRKADQHEALHSRASQRRLGLQAVLWLCVAGAALTKGLPAMLLIIYTVLGARLIAGRWSAVRSTGIVWGLPLAIGLVGLWGYAAYASNPEHFTSTYIKDEVINRVGRGGFLTIVGEQWKMPAWFVARFAPWSLFAIMGAAHVMGKKHRPHRPSDLLGLSVLWLFLVIVFFGFSGGKRADYLAPACPAAAVLASFWLVFEGRRFLNLRPGPVASAGLAVALVIGVYEYAASPAAREGYGQNIKAFAWQVHQQTGGQPLLFQDTDYTPVQALLGYNQTHIDPVKPPEALWLIKPLDEPGARVISEPIWAGAKDPTITLALYALESLSGGKE